MAKDMTKGSLVRALIEFSIPLILSGVLQQLYSWADAFIVGNIEGGTALAAIGSTTSIIYLFTGAIQGFTNGISILAARYFGEGKDEVQRKLLSSFTVAMGVFFVALSALGVCFVEAILQILDTPADIYQMSGEYLRIVLIGIPFIAVYNVYSAVLRGCGDSKAPFYAVLVSSLANIVLDLVFVGGFRWSVAGAAAATAISQIAMTLFMIGYTMKRYEILRFRLGKNLVDRKVLQEGSTFSLPLTINSMISSLGSVALQSFMNSFGSTTVAAISTAYRVDSIIMLPVMNLGAGISTVTSQNLGAGQKQRVKKGLYVGVGIMTAVSVLMTVFVIRFGGTLVALFGISEESVAIGKAFFQALAMFYLLFGISVAIRGYIQGIGDVQFTSFIGISSLAVRIGMSYALKPFFGNMVIAYAEVISWWYMFAMYGGRLFWHRMKGSVDHGV
ncbi:MAG: MATE family efflux transporter [Lachnospiraceae bacterium]|nr:MATE family efflux transporter [Lachnospiraceae bacterium]